MKGKYNMANWDDIKTTVGRAANKTIKKAGELADIASLRLKHKSTKAKLGEKFERLGRLTYKQLKTEISHAEEIAKTITEIDELRNELKLINQKVEELKKQRYEERVKDAEAEAEDEEYEEEADIADDDDDAEIADEAAEAEETPVETETETTDSAEEE
ncbi:MAG: hypothetical protein J6A83_02395 [Clostridia bacterium]|nr:hypothetical protein [Clostridia bacterium]